MRVAIIYDRANKIGGAERVLTDLHQIFPDAPLYVLVHNPQTATWSRGIRVIPSFFNRIKYLRTHHEILAPFASLAFESFDLKKFDVVISVTSADAKSVITRPETLHICYCLTPTRYLWSGVKEYRKNFRSGALFDFSLQYFQKVDKVISNRPDHYLAISKEVQKRIETYYQKKSEIIYPAIDFEFFSKTRRYKKQDYYLVVNRLVPYKRTDIVIQAFNELKKPLMIVGTGSYEKKLKKMAKDNIEFLGEISDEKLRQVYARAKALIFSQSEDFGLTPLEAAAAGTPTLAYASGGALETIIGNDTGLFFNEQTKESIQACVQKFESGRHQISLKHCREQAEKFGSHRFRAEFSDKVKTLWSQYQKRLP